MLPSTHHGPVEVAVHTARPFLSWQSSPRVAKSACHKVTIKLALAVFLGPSAWSLGNSQSKEKIIQFDGFCLPSHGYKCPWLKSSRRKIRALVTLGRLRQGKDGALQASQCPYTAGSGDHGSSHMGGFIQPLCCSWHNSTNHSYSPAFSHSNAHIHSEHFFLTPFCFLS